jgi:hypothetical protein
MKGTPLATLIVVGLLAWTVLAQSSGVTVSRDVNLRPDPSTEYAAIRLLTPREPPLSLLDPRPESGYYHVRTSAGEEGYVWAASVRVSTSVPAAPGASALGPISLGVGTPGSAGMMGCGDDLWAHVYNPSRLLVQQDCATVTGTIVDATATRSHPEPDGVRHEPDGDTHGWLKVDPTFANLINAGNASAENGNLVFEVVCHFPVSQSDAQASCVGFADHTVIPPPGTHVAIRGTLVTESHHAKWNEIHPVSSITVK